MVVEGEGAGAYVQYSETGTTIQLLNFQLTQYSDLPIVDQTNPSMTRINRTANRRVDCLAIKISRHAVNAIFRGKMQYPSTQILWKNDLQY